MAKGKIRIGHLVVIVILAAMVGTALGDLLLSVFPNSGAVAFLAQGVRFGTSAPFDLDVRVAQVTLGGGVRLTLLGGILAATALLLFIRRT
ncbi:MAG TPA: hypothetical protein VJV75_07475 [Candidatus Polarisedimenticolia bacterium]|nr:hypothetical protein [Candidatus Polarisedimenticolia bacterium]